MAIAHWEFGTLDGTEIATRNQTEFADESDDDDSDTDTEDSDGVTQSR